MREVALASRIVLDTTKEGENEVGKRPNRRLDMGGITVAVARLWARHLPPNEATRPRRTELGHPPRGFPVGISGLDRLPAASSRSPRVIETRSS